jgi:hypothetical protein
MRNERSIDTGMLGILRTRSLRRHCLGLPLLLCLVVLSAGCASSRVRKSAEPPPPSPYMRVAHPDADTVALQIAIRKFTPAKGRGPAIWLTGVSHIGESNYYAAVQRHLDSQSLVLYEGVGARDKSIRFDPEEQASIQNTLATSLGLVFQLSAIDYDRPSFKNSDLSIPELQRMLAGETTTSGTADTADTAGSAPAENPEFQQLLGVMDGSSFLGVLVHIGIKLISSSPKLQAMSRLVLIEMLGHFQADLSEMEGVPPELQRLMTVIIRGRNEVVIRDLKKQLARMPPNQSISVFYGAGHMPDLEKRLFEELGYRRREEAWLTAISLNTRASALTKAELDMVQSLIRGQMEAMKSQARPKSAR